MPPTKRQEIVRAIVNDKTEELEQLLQRDTDWELLRWCYPLHKACVFQSTKVLGFLLENNVTSDINTKNPDTLEMGGSINLYTPLEIACLKKGSVLMKMLLSAGAKPEQTVEYYEGTDEHELYPVHYAAMKFDQNLVQLLVSLNANINKVGQVMCEGFEVDPTYNVPLPTKVKFSLTPLCAAILFMKKRNPRPRYLECIRYMLQAGADPNLKCDGVKLSPLQAAVQKGWFSAVKLLLEFGADVHYPVCHEYPGVYPDQGLRLYFIEALPSSLMHLAIKSGKIGILELLVGHGLDANEHIPVDKPIYFPSFPVNKGILTPLSIACYSRKLHMLESLVRLGADANAPCGNIQKGFLSVDCEYGERDDLITAPNLVWLLAAQLHTFKGPHHKKELASKTFPLLAEYCTDFNVVEPQTGLRPLQLVTHRIWRNPNFTLDLIKSFISFGADVNFQNAAGKSCLHIIFGFFRKRTSTAQDKKQVIPMIDIIAPVMDNIDVKNNSSESVLYQSVKYGRWDVTFTLLKHGASLWGESWFLKNECILDPEAIHSAETIRVFFPSIRTSRNSR